MAFDDEGLTRTSNLDDMNLYGKGDWRGGDMNFKCKHCGKYLTTIKLNPYCTIDIRIECRTCGSIGEGRNLRATLEGKV